MSSTWHLNSPFFSLLHRAGTRPRSQRSSLLMTWRAAPVKRGNLNCSSTFLLHGQHPAEPPSELKDWLHLHPLSDFILLNNGCFSFRSSTLSCVQSDRFLTHRVFQQTHLYILSGFQQHILLQTTSLSHLDCESHRSGWPLCSTVNQRDCK